jgi:serine/threonine-protein kinase RsbT
VNPTKIPRNNHSYPISHETTIERVVTGTLWLSGKIGFKDTSRCMIATAVCELARNINRYANSDGVIHISKIKRNGVSGIEITASDNGPGIQDIDQAMQDGYSTTKGSLGVGLLGVKRLMDEFKIKSDKGTTVTIRKWVK